jgi:hypothetical protein
MNPELEFGLSDSVVPWPAALVVLPRFLPEDAVEGTGRVSSITGEGSEAGELVTSVALRVS